MFIAVIGEYGPGSARIGDLVLLRDEVLATIRELIGQVLPGSSRIIRYVTFKGSWDDPSYGEILAYAD